MAPGAAGLGGDRIGPWSRPGPVRSWKIATLERFIVPIAYRLPGRRGSAGGSTDSVCTATALLKGSQGIGAGLQRLLDQQAAFESGQPPGPIVPQSMLTALSTRTIRKMVTALSVSPVTREWRVNDTYFDRKLGA